jgi:hypothetical protein
MKRGCQKGIKLLRYGVDKLRALDRRAGWLNQFRACVLHIADGRRDRPHFHVVGWERTQKRGAFVGLAKPASATVRLVGLLRSISCAANFIMPGCIGEP